MAAVFLVPAAPSGAASTTTVVEKDTQYVPAQVDIHVGDTVQWVFESAPPGTQGHTVTFNDKDLNGSCPGILINDCQRAPSDVVHRTFTSAGTYPYRCKIQSGMSGVVVVSAAPASSTTTPSGSSTTASGKSSTTTVTRLATSSTTSTTRVLATSSSVLRSTTTSSDPSAVLLPGAAPPFSGDDANGNAAGHSSSKDGGNDSRTVALIVGALLVVAAGGGYLLWRLRPGRAA